MVTRLDALLGQERAVAHLSASLASSGNSGIRPSGAYLFAGPDGVGKESAARAFAAAIVCRNSDPLGACGECPDCRLVASDNHPNLIVLRPKGQNIKVEQVRDLTTGLGRVPFLDRPRVVTVIPAERLHPAAANALLKVLEEPPRDTTFILVTHRLASILPTIASRCRKVPFAPLPSSEIVSLLSERPETAGVPPDRLAAVAAIAGGSPGRTLALLPDFDEFRSGWIRQVTSHSSAAITTFSQQFKRKAAKKAKGAKGAAAGEVDAPDDTEEESEGGGERSTAGITVGLAILRDLAVASAGEAEAIMNADIGGEIQSVAAMRTTEGWSAAWRAFQTLTRISPTMQLPLAVEAYLHTLHGKA